MARKKTNTSRKQKAKAKPTRGGTRSGRASSRSRSKSTSKRSLSLNLAQKTLIAGIAIIFTTAILVLSLLSPNQGELTSALSGLLWRLFGWGGILVPLITGAAGLYLVLWGMDQQPQLPIYRLIGFGVLFLTLQAFASLAMVTWDNGLNDVWAVAQAQTGGGYVGGLLTYALTGAVGTLGAIFTLMVTGLAGLILLSGVTRQDASHLLQAGFAFLNAFRRSPDRSTAGEARQIPINNGRSPSPASSKSPVATQPSLLTGMASSGKNVTPSPPAATKSPVRGGTRGSQPARPEVKEQPTVLSPVIMGDSGRSRQVNWQLPTLTDILAPGMDLDSSGAMIREQVEIIEHTLESFGAPATVVEINQGPTITQFGVEPSFIEMRSGKRTKVKVGKIASLADDLALALAAHAIRIQAPVPGKGYVGIEVPNPAKSLVSLRDVMETPQFQRIKSPLRIGLGQDVAGQPIVADLAAMPHLLIAGTTGSGKSVCVNGIIACLLLQNTPEALKLVMIDPKRVELTNYNGIPHLAAPVIVEMDRVIGTLQWAMREMDSRYKMFAEVGARNIADYNKKVRRNKDIDALPHIVIIIDELADLMMLAPEDTERAVTRLAQLARATGMHVVIATQRPSVDVVTGLIKANFPARIAFAVASGTDSRVILDATGAERLLGQGDMLYQSPDAAAPVRAQGCFVSDGELNKLIEYWRTARRFNIIPAAESVPRRDEAPLQKPPTSPTIQPPVINLDRTRQRTAESPKPPPAPAEAADRPVPKPDKATTEADVEAAADAPTRVARQGMQQPLWEALQEIEAQPEEVEDDLLPEAIELVKKLNKASTSLLQRRFRIGYTRAARLIDYMEEAGIIGPPTGTSKAREVLVGNEDAAPDPDEKKDDQDG